MPTDVWKDKQNMVCIYNGILLSLKKEWNSDTCNDMDDPWKCQAKWRKPYTEGQILFHLYELPRLGESIKTESRIMVTGG